MTQELADEELSEQELATEANEDAAEVSERQGKSSKIAGKCGDGNAFDQLLRYCRGRRCSEEQPSNI
jgi:hypothetical protein